MESDKVKPMTFLVQLFATISIAYLTSLTGFVYAWPSYTLANFVSNETVLSWPMSPLEVSLYGSLINVGGLIATPLCGFALDTFGRKYTAMLFGLPYVLAWAIISMTNYVPLVLVATCIAGFGAGGQAGSSVFISEISHDSIRGALTSCCVSGYFVGLLFSYIIGAYLSYNMVLYIHLALSVLYLVLLTLLKESPVFLVQKGKEKEAAKSLGFYRHVDTTSKEVEIEIRKIKLQLDPRIEKILQEGQDLNAVDNLIEDKPEDTDIPKQSAIQFLRNSESSKRALFTVLMLMSLSILMGTIVLQVYAEFLMNEAIPTMSSSLGVILLAIDFLVATLVCSLFVDRFGRKFLMTSTSAASGICTILLATQLQLHWAPHWFTAVLIYLYCFVYSFGAAVVPFILTAEVFLPEVRSFCNSMSMACMWIINFVTISIFNLLVELVGLAPLFYFFSAVCFIGAVYSHFCLPETKGLSADAIQPLFMKKRKVRKEEIIGGK